MYCIQVYLSFQTNGPSNSMYVGGYFLKTIHNWSKLWKSRLVHYEFRTHLKEVNHPHVGVLF